MIRHLLILIRYPAERTSSLNNIVHLLFKLSSLYKLLISMNENNIVETDIIWII